MEEAIEKLTNLLITSHHLDHVDRKALLESTLERERQVSTCLEGGLAVPHGELPEGTPMVGVMGISRRGLHVETPDGRPLHCVVLLATPRGERERHLAVLAALARTVGADPVIQQQLYSAKSPAHVCEILHGEETEDFNYFLEDQEQSGF
jgi:mannitol/fructose-specific phosphotransferase system IIA component (Ntr-type)